MRKHGTWTGAAAAVFLGALLLTGCGGKSAQKAEGLEALGQVTAVTRESDSGTRGSFDDLTGIAAEKDGIAEAGSTEDMLKAVSGSASAIGYLTADAADGSVKTLSVDGKELTERGYPLTRKLYLAYKGELTDLEREFLTYVTGAGQEIVGKSFETVGKTETFLSMKPEGTLEIGGSSSEAPVMEKLADAYMKENPNASVTVKTTDSGDGISGALDGTYDLGMSSRSPKDYEKTLLTFTAVAKDRIAVIVQKDNPLEDISRKELREIYTGKTENWADLG